jgi:alpha-beta hydrolase superfamily lysophospholipase
MTLRRLLLGVLAAFASGCVSFPGAPPPTTAPVIAGETVISADGSALALTKWEAQAPSGVLIAVHGMNDYAAAFTYAGPYWAERGLSVYAYDQRGFGRSPMKGRWPGGAALKQDLRAAIAAARSRHPGLPVYAVGHSMGAAVILAAMKEAPLDVDGVILAAPGIWGGASMPIVYRASLNLAAAFAPGRTLTGERADRQATDNLEFLRAMSRDPAVIKETRIDAVLGAVRLMGDAWDATDEVGGDVLFLYGEKDEIIPVKAMRKAGARLCGSVKTVSFSGSWHLLFADLGREAPLQEAVRWVADQQGRETLGAGQCADRLSTEPVVVQKPG